MMDESISDTPCTVKSQETAQYIADSFADNHSACVIKGSFTNQVRLDCASRHEAMGPLMKIAKEFRNLYESQNRHGLSGSQSHAAEPINSIVQSEDIHSTEVKVVIVNL
jgi:hypothetical protein